MIQQITICVLIHPTTSSLKSLISAFVRCREPQRKRTNNSFVATQSLKRKEFFNYDLSVAILQYRAVATARKMCVTAVQAI